jgi:hypothetical protein
MFESNRQEIYDEKIQNARFSIFTTVIIALGINLVASFITSQPWVAIVMLTITSLITIYILAHYSGVSTLITHDIQTNVIFDGNTGELTNYPDHIIQHFMRQTIDVVSKTNPNIKSKIVESRSLCLNDKKRGILIDIAETVILSQILGLLSFLPREYLEDFQETSQLPIDLHENEIMESILAVKDKSDRQVLINTFDTFWKPKNGSFLIFQNPHYNSLPLWYFKQTGKNDTKKWEEVV